MIISKKTPLIINAVLLVLNFILIYKNFKNQFVISELQSQIIRLENSNYKISNSNIDEVQKLDLASLNIGDKKFILLTLIRDDVCGYCLINEIKYLNKIYSKYSNHIKVYYEGYANKLTSLGANFEIIEVLNLSDKFQVSNNITDNPASFLIDKNGYIQSYHKAIPGRPEVSARFFEKVKSLFQTVYEN
ncbi:Hypothetical protein IALB_0691 [Ignavibacterium album JCM 16511]|uniref:Thioredoxin domain-containing protein n=1 Tax=Ignavibacterium album (strain DSM 19864 / JCM 16511 / NBRC 101810 / Mat9-16) TaxID=945713 RepID=I0AHE6_IGNAJ|nr:hypothetical protein [Ignavibacterium album]AFH48403.1 Hypothetical protein IALB_0691 [Ignavibacterium album JCM 16511]